MRLFSKPKTSHYSRGVTIWQKLRATVWLLPAWFAPHYKLRVLFHRLRGVKMGKNVFVGYYCTLDNVHPEMLELQDGCSVCANSTILTHDDFLPKVTRGTEATLKPVVVKRNATIGIGVMILPGVTIGENAVVGAYSFISRNVPDNTMIVSPRKAFSVKMPSVMINKTRE